MGSNTIAHGLALHVQADADDRSSSPDVAVCGICSKMRGSYSVTRGSVDEVSSEEQTLLSPLEPGSASTVCTVYIIPASVCTISLVLQN